MPPSAVVTVSEMVPVPPVPVMVMEMSSVEVKPCWVFVQCSESVPPLHISVQPMLGIGAPPSYVLVDVMGVWQVEEFPVPDGVNVVV